MSKIDYNKLIRDRIPEIMDAKSVKYEVRTLAPEELVPALAAKILEEAKEVHDAVDDREELIKEFADLQEVIDTLMKEKWISREEVLAVQQERKQKRGGFEKKLFLEWTEE